VQSVKTTRNLKPKEKKKVNLKQFYPLYLMALPAVIYIIINNYMPLYGIQLAFRELDFSTSIFKGKFVGLDNFKFLFATKDAWIITRNTVLYNLLFIITDMVVGLSVSILFNEIKNKALRKFYQSAMLIPYVISMVIVSYLAFAFLSNETGFINHSILKPLGIEPISWYQEPKFWPFILLFVHNWKGIGYSILMYTARILSISDEYYEAAEIDSATKWQQIRYITLPMLKPVLFMILILAIGRMFYSDFGLFYQIPMSSGALYNATNTIDTYSFRALMKVGDVTMSAATGFYQSVVGFILLIAANATVRKLSKDDSIF
jgi:putative aldouronate transport system permease protein